MRPAGPAPPPPPAPATRRRPRRARPPPTPPARGRPSSKPSSAKPSTSCPGPAAWRRFLRRRQLGARLGGPSLPLDIGYSETIPAGIRNAVILRDKHCQWAGRCNQPASACQVHHVKHKANGGKTSIKDCVLLCFFHHQVVIHRWGWTLVLNPDGTTTAWNPDKTKVLHSHSPPARRRVTPPGESGPQDSQRQASTGKTGQEPGAPHPRVNVAHEAFHPAGSASLETADAEGSGSGHLPLCLTHVGSRVLVHAETPAKFRASKATKATARSWRRCNPARRRKSVRPSRSSSAM